MIESFYSPPHKYNPIHDMAMFDDFLVYTIWFTYDFTPMSAKGEYPWGGMVREGKGNASLGLVLGEICP